MTEPGTSKRFREERDSTIVALFLVLAVLGAAGFVTAYVVEAGTQWEGATLAASFACLGAAFVFWGHRLLAEPEAVESRHSLSSTPAQRAAVVTAADAEGVLERRPALRRMVLAAVGAIGVALVVPFRSLGPRPTVVRPFRRGTRLVDESGRPVSISDVPRDSLMTAFPEGGTGGALGQVVLLRVAPELLESDGERRSWSPEGLIAYSKVCTHAGCPVGLYESQSKTLLCPCHQSVFDVLDRARPTSGPAAAPLPQLPLAVDRSGHVVADGEFSDPVGPASWFQR